MTSPERLTSKISLAEWTASNKRSALQDMLVVSARSKVLSFALGLPAAELFPTARLSQAAAHVLATDECALQYGPPFQPLKTHVVALMQARGVTCREEQVFLTAGAQQGLSLLVRLLLDPGGTVLLEEKVYTGFQQALHPYQPHILTVPTDLQTGMDVAAVEELLKSGASPSLIYSVTDGNNPLAVSMELEKRRRLAELAREYRVPVIEDDPYGFLYYEDTCLPPLRAFDDEWVFYVGTFSKILAPALRTGWLVVPESLTGHLAIIKEATDIDMSSLTQRVISAYLDTGDLPAHLQTLRSQYRERLDAMTGALEAYFPAGTRWHRPTNGLFIWVELPGEVDSAALLQTTLKTEKVAFLPGHAFNVTPDDGARNCIRLNFTNSTVEQIQEGMALLGRAVKSRLCRAAAEPR